MTDMPTNNGIRVVEVLMDKEAALLLMVGIVALIVFYEVGSWLISLAFG